MYNILKNSIEYDNIINSLNDGLRNIFVGNLTDSSLIHFISTFSEKKKVIITSNEYKAKEIYNDLLFYDTNSLIYPEKDLLFGNANVVSKDLSKSRTEVIYDIINNTNSTTIFTISSLMEKIEKKESYIDDILKLKIKQEISFDKLISIFTKLQYERVSEVDDYGDFSIKGGIIDIFPYTYNDPIRILFDNDEIESISFYNIQTKRTTKKTEEVTINPLVKNNNKESNILSYFDKDTYFFIVDHNSIKEKGKIIEEMVFENKIKRENENLNEEIYYIDDILPLHKIFIELEDFICINLQVLDNNIDIFPIKSSSPSFIKSDYDAIINELRRLLNDGYKGIIVLNSHTKAERLKEDLNEKNIHTIIKDKNSEFDENTITLTFGNLKKGFLYDNAKFFIFSENDLFNINVEKKKKYNKFKEDENLVKINKLSNLKLGDYIVHESYGIGIYKGTKSLKQNNITTEYIVIEYADNGILYIPCTNMDVVMKYASIEAKRPHINKLNSYEWKRTKQKVKQEVMDMAKELIELYASRLNNKGYEFSKDNIWQKEFEETFPYEETLDQTKAIISTKRDMEDSKCMDRLICGDVGFGKTEVALRASFKAIQDSKQVAFMVPTTILCQQHYNTFKDRMSSFPIKVDYLSRFKTKKENNETIEKIKDGSIDIIIGTHRLLSSDVKFKDLGLLIIDEEQRFGVSHKEKIKKIKSNVDVLTLSATPIPRTLSMSLSGIRDMSLLTEAPPERVPIQTYVLEYNDELIREAIEREINRNGQVFFVHNRISDIYEISRKLEKIVPNAKIAIAHGKMKENELEDIMQEFINGEINVLVTTTIIETGLDIQNANTLIVLNADRFGISQLYQLRGRIGRSEREAFAFFMYKKGKMLTEEQNKRLKAIKEFTSLGSGIKIAMRDLEIRGAGNILGLSQSGHIDAIGYDMYHKLLENAIMYLKMDKEEDKIKSEFDTSIEIDIDAYIPTYYVENEEEKLDLYKKISICKNDIDLQNIKEELIDRFGKYPKEVKNLLFIASLKQKAHECYITELKIKDSFLSMKFFKNANIKNEMIPILIEKYKGNIRFAQGEEPILVYRKRVNEQVSIEYNIDLCEKIFELIKK
ncbi:MAG: transcription-repair coupling factor [Eubacteriales bacterium]|nr:transcription-repair coupling factor [Eubacteriales bacterium]